LLCAVQLLLLMPLLMPLCRFPGDAPATSLQALPCPLQARATCLRPSAFSPLPFWRPCACFRCDRRGFFAPSRFPHRCISVSFDFLTFGVNLLQGEFSRPVLLACLVFCCTWQAFFVSFPDCRFQQSGNKPALPRVISPVLDADQGIPGRFQGGAQTPVFGLQRFAVIAAAHCQFFPCFFFCCHRVFPLLFPFPFMLCCSTPARRFQQGYLLIYSFASLATDSGNFARSPRHDPRDQ